MACRRAVVTCLLLACWSCQQCWAFLGSVPFYSDPAGTKLQHGSSSIAIRKHDSAQQGERLRGSSSWSSSGKRVMAAPAELWDNYLHALEVAPLLTKVCLDKTRPRRGCCGCSDRESLVFGYTCVCAAQRSAAAYYEVRT